ncbi:glycosyltransferase family 2 protein [Pelagibacterales bacterium SAG-MED45]|nr:glycosyltransferase family 2 protein [Pelagibacterales bacterium SAG-MED45]|tara:strand:+ start:2353 stop:3138 length:786 start_codon:yes stop_codon:yes gene_type:complete
MTKNTVIITAENKDKTIIKTIQSCLNQTDKDIEIIVAFSKLKNENQIRSNFKSKKVVFFKIKKKLKNKVQDQLFKIKQSLKISKGKNLFLLDGDDMFSKNKVKVISKILKNREIMILDNYFILKDNKKIKSKYSNFKNNDFYKKLINDWPKNVCTSAISIKKELLLKFFSEIKIKKYKFLAIDILLAIYCNNKKKIIKFNRYFTSKVELSDSVDKDYTGFNNKLYWQRRLEQHKYNFFINKRIYFNLDFFISYLMCLILKV